jgi:hypothetical protein
MSSTGLAYHTVHVGQVVASSTVCVEVFLKSFLKIMLRNEFSVSLSIVSWQKDFLNLLLIKFVVRERVSIFINRVFR